MLKNTKGANSYEHCLFDLFNLFILSYKFARIFYCIIVIIIMIQQKCLAFSMAILDKISVSLSPLLLNVSLLNFSC